MERAALKDVFYGGLEELVTDPRYFYYMNYSSKFNRSHLTDAGRKAVDDYMALMLPQIAQAHRQHLEEEAKILVMKELTKQPKD